MPAGLFGERLAQSVSRSLAFYTPQGQMGRVFALFTPIAAESQERWFQQIVNLAKFLRSVADSDPKNSRPARIGKTSNPFHRQGEGRLLF
jgi:hypothetical protein